MKEIWIKGESFSIHKCCENWKSRIKVVWPSMRQKNNSHYSYSHIHHILESLKRLLLSLLLFTDIIFSLMRQKRNYKKSKFSFDSIEMKQQNEE